MTDRKWFKGDNGLWTSRDRVLIRQEARDAGRERVRGIRERLAAVIARDGWKRRGRPLRWVRVA